MTRDRGTPSHGSGLVMLLITLVACLAPYRRALGIDPGRTLTDE